MKLKELWSKTNKWLRLRRPPTAEEPEAEINNEGLIKKDIEGVPEAVEEEIESQSGRDSGQAESSEDARGFEEESSVVVAPETASEKGESIEKLQRGFDRLIERLANINDNLNLQVSQHRELLERLDKMPELAKSFPAIVENQEQIRVKLSEQLSSMVASNEQFIESVEKIPTETARQTEMLSEIKKRLASAAEVDSAMSEGFRQFNETLEKLDQNTLGQTDSIMQMSKTFATSDRYLKYIISRQNKRFMWLFVISLGVCVIAILLLAGIIIYLNQ